MAKPVFNRNLFGAKRLERGKGEFPEVSSGTYICHLQRAHIGEAKTSGCLQAVFGYQIEDESPDFPSQYIWEYIRLTNQDGIDQEGGYDALAIRLSTLRVADSGNIDSDIESAIGSKVRLDYTAGDKDAVENKHKFDKFRIKRLISKPDGSTAVEGYKAAGVAAPEELDAQQEGIEIEPGMIVQLNTMEKLEVVALLEKNDSNDGKDYLMTKPIGGG